MSYDLDLEVDFREGPATIKAKGTLLLSVPGGTLVKNEGKWTISLKLGETTSIGGDVKVVETVKRTIPGRK